MGYCDKIPPCTNCGHDACDHEVPLPHPCTSCACEEFVFPEGMNESQFQGGGGGFGGGGATGGW